MRRLVVVHCVALVVMCNVSFVGANEEASAPGQSGRFSNVALLPKEETGATRFLTANPEYDGRGVIVAIFDQGIDPGASGLSVTTTGAPKIIDLIDGTGSGDVPMKPAKLESDGTITSLTDRTLSIDPDWSNPSGKYFVGVKAAFDLYPHDLVSRLQAEAKEDFIKAQRPREIQLIEDEQAADGDEARKEAAARLEALREAVKQFKAPGPVLDCITFHDGDHWRAVIDLDEDGDLADETPLADYRVEHQFATFGGGAELNFSVNIFDDGKLLSIVAVCGNHGTHVAGIVGANYPDNPSRNGLAPGVQFISVKIGDTRLDGMETGVALMRGLARTAELNCDLVNMSYGEPSSTPNQGALIDSINQFVVNRNIVFVASAGNSGPALSTVGSPGGTSSFPIGVGAYVSPAMGREEYALQEDLPGLPFTWTSRGPTTDGDWGVDLFAPGAAIAPVSQYSLQPSMRMNGTSMAAPNACGNIALMISGLKAQELSYSSTSLLRSLQATSQIQSEIDPLAQGPGLIQIDQAFDHHVANKSSKTSLTPVTVSISSRNGARGIYLREAGEVGRRVDVSIQVEPDFPLETANSTKLSYEVPIRLESNADWVKVGSQLLLTHGGARFSATVDSRELTPGLHIARIQGQPASQVGNENLFEVPVVVIVPEPSSEQVFQTTLETTSGSIQRIFLNPPEGSRSYKLRVKRLDGIGEGFFYLHCVQTSPVQSFEAAESKLVVSLGVGEEFEKEISLPTDRVLEICTAQYWSSLGQSELELEVTYSGLATTSDSVTLASNGESVPVRVTSQLGHERVDPSAVLNRWDRFLSPQKSSLKILSDERNTTWNNEPTWQLVCDYAFQLEKKDQVTFALSRLDDLLYESPFPSYRLFVYDEHNQLVHADDVFPESVSLPEGDYSIQIELRHTDRDHLKEMEGSLLTITRSIGSVRPSIYSSRAVAAAPWKQSDVSSTELFELMREDYSIAPPPKDKLPQGLQSGDRLRGQLTLRSGDPNPVPIEYFFSDGAQPASSKSAKQTVPTEEIDFLLAKLGTLSWEKDQEEIERLAERILAIDEDNLDVHVERLHLADDDDRKKHLGTVVELADQVIDHIPQNKIRKYFDRRRTQSTSEEKETKKKWETARKHLIDAIYRKGRALAYMELPDVIEDHPIDDPKQHEKEFDANFQLLSSWVDPTSKDYFLLQIRYDRRRGNFGEALKILNKNFGSGQPVYFHYKKRRDLYELLGWDDLRDIEQHWMWRYFPESKVPF
ncbi:S8 family serine peptidase [Thalassoglobus sp. JC818]|uniref:S8 family serine peptidase n=1 Tax=Thalassoglobus sp. JC818 TaxID=3232136 RepID=UPI003459237B